MKFLTTKLLCFPSLVNFLPHLIYAWLTYDTPKLFLPLFNLILVETCHKGTKGPLFLSMQLFVSFTHCSYHNNISQRFIKQNSEFIFLLFNPYMVSHSLIIDFFSLVFLHDFIFKATYNTSTNLILTNSAILSSFT
jgi:hypothetical protein